LVLKSHDCNGGENSLDVRDTIWGDPFHNECHWPSESWAQIRIIFPGLYISYIETLTG